MVFEIIFRVDPKKYGLKKTDLINGHERKEKYFNSLTKVVDEILDYSYYYSKDKEYEEIFIEGRLQHARSIKLDKVRSVLYRQFFNDGIIGFNQSGEIEDVYLEKVLFEE
ncbi:hypothetical protein Marpi_2125 (plasmid) [Marinitoga piezophila KA3]|uniref:Uncharacterized protein n=1 Tax=Marinitoga piezophila (strain DSM 14283 / JCM 11233 / KA3) TaxID=443254 RepID=H2J8G7_MARPK|nr:hypothetical protein [Marinitoga piezophila]AEX86498.1 hypothetical protein Marpi_2125 [Marinitoga piezophila KA3]